MVVIVSISGKGGAGKTAIAALMLRSLLRRGVRGVLMVDADPATNLPEALGVHLEKTVGDVVNELKKKITGDELPPDIDKKALLESVVLQTLVETQGFDLLAMGRTEGEGCYCLVNTLLTDVIDTLSGNYGVVIMDMEAGLEHLSRRTDRDVDLMLIVTDPSRMGFNTARRIRDLAHEVHIRFKRICLVGNMFPPGEELRKALDSLGMDVIAVVPVDPSVATFNAAGRPLLELPDDSPAAAAVGALVEKLGLVG